MSFTCNQCGQAFQLPPQILERYPGWKPQLCRGCRDGGTHGGGKRVRARAPKGAASRREQNLTVAEVLEKYTDGPRSGVFTDGSAEPNPGPGGWGAVYVVDDEIIAEAHGGESHTTNNRMELTALIAGYRLVPNGQSAVVWTDSQLCVNTITQWAKGWEARGWRRKGGEIKNLDLVKELYALACSRPDLELRWIQAHAGSRWNEYADSLASAYRREHK